jgi:hypothetical protein
LGAGRLGGWGEYLVNIAEGLGGWGEYLVNIAEGRRTAQERLGCHRTNALEHFSEVTKLSHLKALPRMERLFTRLPTTNYDI